MKYWTKEEIIEALELSALAAEVTLPADQYRDLLEKALHHYNTHGTPVEEAQPCPDNKEALEVFNKGRRIHQPVGYDTFVYEFTQKDLDTIIKALQAPAVDVEKLKLEVLGEYVLKTDGDYNEDCVEMALFDFCIDYLVSQGHLTAKEKWQPIETAPRDKMVLTWDGQYIRCAQYIYENVWMQGSDMGHTPTHWMPLPPPPNKENDDENT